MDLEKVKRGEIKNLEGANFKGEEYCLNINSNNYEASDFLFKRLTPFV